MAASHNPCTVTLHAPKGDPFLDVKIRDEGAADAPMQIGGTPTRVVISPPERAPARIVSGGSVQRMTQAEAGADTTNRIAGAALPPVGNVQHGGLPTQVEILGPVKIEPPKQGKPGDVERLEGLEPITVEHHAAPSSSSSSSSPSPLAAEVPPSTGSKKGKQR